MTSRPRFRLSGPTIGAIDPLSLAEFYAQLLGWPIVDCEGAGERSDDEEPWATLRSPDGSLKIEIQYEPGFQRPVWPPEPGRPRMMMHLDIGVSDFDAGVAWAEECGAAQAGHQPQDGVRVMLDPEGHPFCLFIDPGA